MTAAQEVLGEMRVIGALAAENEGPEECRIDAIVDRYAHAQNRLDAERAGRQSARLVDLYWHLFAPPGHGREWLAARAAASREADESVRA